PLSMADAADKFKIKQNHARNYIDFDIDTNRVEFRKNDLGVEEVKIQPYKIWEFSIDFNAADERSGVGAAWLIFAGWRRERPIRPA
ncbi:hypothetical protein ONQ60_25670, partial [Salmonella enterica subsp. enterica serovar Virginia]|nr:hypothetical protein [Salmonella enterica subsp. enterica serovar Virginia]